MGVNGPNPEQARAKAAAMVDDRRALVAKLKVRGLSLRQVRVEMAEQGHLNPKTGRPWSITILSRDVLWLEEQWQAAAARDTDIWKQRELAQLDDVEREAREAWARGIGKKQKTTQEKTTGGRDGGGTKASIVTEELNGDPRYLNVILECQQRRARLLGLDAALKTEHSGPGGGAIEITDSERAEKIGVLIEAALARIEKEPQK